jgi:hypothetical protein
MLELNVFSGMFSVLELVAILLYGWEMIQLMKFLSRIGTETLDVGYSSI